MPYDVRDPRSGLGAGPSRPSAATAADAAAPAEYVPLGRGDAQRVEPGGSRSWVTRSQTACLVYTDALAGEVLARTAQHDEYVVLLLSTPERPAAHVTVRAGGGLEGAPTEAAPARVDSDAVIVVPPGASTVTVESPGVVVRLFTNLAADLTALAVNAATHGTSHPHCAPFAPWPPAPTGDRLRVYRLADVPADPTRFGTIFRCRTVMVNVLPPDAGPRDPARLSPHHHDDFEQLSLQLDGDYVHHIRTPWTTDLASWRDDEHQLVSSPALIVIPPPAVHTSQGVGNHRHHLVDLFCPPRLDFSRRPGWVVNAADYPTLPDEVG